MHGNFHKQQLFNIATGNIARSTSVFDMSNNGVGGLRSAVNEFMSNTNVHGLGNIHHEKSKITKGVWTILVVVGTVCTFKNSVDTIQTYIQFNSFTSVYIQRNTSLDFPAVAICNNNAIHCSNLYHRVKRCKKEACSKYQLYCKIYMLTQCAYTIALLKAQDNNESNAMSRDDECMEFMTEFNGNICNCNSTICVEDCEQFERFKALNIPIIVDTTFSTLDHSLPNLVSKLTTDEISEISQFPKEFIVNCDTPGAFSKGSFQCIETKFRGGYAKLFVPQGSNMHRICYTFNHGGIELFRDQDIAGGRHLELILTLYLDTQNYGFKIPRSMHSEWYPHGATLLIYDKNKIPNMIEDAVSISPGQDTVINMETVINKRLRYPYASNCTQEWPFQSVLINTTFSTYSQELCEIAYKLEMVRRECGCLDGNSMHLAFLANIDLSNERWCYLNNTHGEDFECNLNTTLDALGISYLEWSSDELLYGQLLNSLILGHCPFACEDLTFKKYVTVTPWLSDTQLLALTDEITTNEGAVKNFNRWSYIHDTLQRPLNNSSSNGPEESTISSRKILDFVRKEHAKVRISFLSHEITSVDERPEYTSFSFLSALGGSFSLFLGISLVACFEIIEISMVILVKLVSRFSSNLTGESASLSFRMIRRPSGGNSEVATIQ